MDKTPSSKPPKSPPQSTLRSSSSGRHVLKLEQLQKQGQSHSDRPIADGELDEQKLYEAWTAMVGVQLELIRVIEKTEQDNEHTRRDNQRTRRFVATLTFVGVALLGLSMVIMLNRQAEQLRAEREASALRIRTHENVASTLRAVRAVARAMGAKIEADAALTPGAESRALKLGVEAQKVAIEAEQAVTRDPRVKQQAERELKTIERKSQEIDAAPAP